MLGQATEAYAALDRCYGAAFTREWNDLHRHAVRALELARRDGDQRAEGRALRYRGVATRETSGGESQASDFRRAITILRAVGDYEHRACAESDLAGYLIATGDAIDALALLDSAQLVFLDLGLEERAQRCDQQKAWADLVVGAYASALRRARELLPMDRAMMSLQGEGWTLRAGALAATFAGDLATALDFAETFFGLARLGNDMVDLLDAHLIYYRVQARRGVEGSADGLAARIPGIDELNERVSSAVARVMLADARLGLVPDLHAFAAREACEAFRGLAHPWLVAELRHLDARWSEMPIRREGSTLVVDLTRADPLAAEHLILDYARLRSAEHRHAHTVDAAKDLGLSRRTFYKVAAAIEERLTGAVTPRRRLRAK